MQPTPGLVLAAHPYVSILTGPFGPVQLATAKYLLEELKRVSILTGPFGPVQRAWAASGHLGAQLFQSSPALSGRCNLLSPLGSYHLE